MEHQWIMTGLRAAITVALCMLFIALIIWAWSPRRRRDFAEAENLVFDAMDTSDSRAGDKAVNARAANAPAGSAEERK